MCPISIFRLYEGYIHTFYSYFYVVNLVWIICNKWLMVQHSNRKLLLKLENIQIQIFLRRWQISLNWTMISTLNVSISIISCQTVTRLNIYDYFTLLLQHKLSKSWRRQNWWHLLWHALQHSGNLLAGHSHVRLGRYGYKNRSFHWYFIQLPIRNQNESLFHIFLCDLFMKLLKIPGPSPH